MVKRLTLGYILDGNNILLGLKKRGFGEGKWNGFGGKIEGVETPQENFIREMKEEVGVTIGRCHEVGTNLIYYNHTGDVYVIYIFLVDSFSGTVTESEEMKPQWFVINAIPFDTMWVADSVWLPIFLKGGRFFGAFQYVSYESFTSHSLDILKTNNH